MDRVNLHIGASIEGKLLSKPENFLPRLERSYSPRVANRSPVPKASSSEKMLFPDIRASKCSSRNSRSSAVEGTRVSTNRCGCMHGYAAISHSGLSRYRVEDRASIVINIPKPQSLVDEHWPRSSLFAIYDGHSGKSCANFLKDRLHNYIFTDHNFPFKVKNAITAAFHKADEEFLLQASEQGEMSGSCALVVLLIGDKCIIANTGDSHAVVSFYKGSKLKAINRIHKPGDPAENQRIVEAGGSIFQNYSIGERGETVFSGPMKVMPGKLKISRAFGNLDAKIERYGGNPKVVIVDPEIKSFSITPEIDFLMIATDSLFEKISYREALDVVWRSVNEHKNQELSVQIAAGIEELTAETRKRQVQDNITIILIVFKSVLIENQD